MRSYIATLTRQSKERDYFQDLTFRAQDACGLDTCPLTDMSNFERYYAGESMDTDKYYVISDNDVIPCRLDMFKEAVEIMEKHPQIGALGFPTKPRMFAAEVSGYVRGLIEPTLWDFDHFGGIRVVRRGVIQKPEERPNYKEGRGGDRIFCDMIRKQGFICALTPDLWFHHLGETMSTIWG